jgi:putative transposase
MNLSLTKTELARLLSVSRQSLYYQKKNRRVEEDEKLKRSIQRLLAHHPAYGSRAIAWSLGMNRKRIQRLMRKYDLAPHIRPKRRETGTSLEKPVIPEVPNRIKHLCPIQPNAIWAGDFTKMWFRGTSVHLATIIDLFTREIVAWQAGTHHTWSLIMDVLEEAKRRRKATPQIFHTDQGSEYTSAKCAQWLSINGVLPSWSKRGKPWQNGVQESFYRNFKLEFGSLTPYASLPSLIEAMGKYMRYYNTKRIHRSLKMAPRTFYQTKKWR